MGARSERTHNQKDECNSWGLWIKEFIGRILGS